MWLPEFNCWNPQEELDAVASVWNPQFPNLEMEDRDGRCVQTLTGQPVWSRLPSEINNRRDTASVKGKSRGDSPKLPFVLTCKLWTQTDLNEMQLSLKPHHHASHVWGAQPWWLPYAQDRFGVFPSLQMFCQQQGSRWLPVIYKHTHTVGLTLYILLCSLFFRPTEKLLTQSDPHAGSCQNKSNVKGQCTRTC